MSCLLVNRFDTYKSKDESFRLAQYMKSIPEGTILSMAVNDEGSRHLDDSARKVMTKLGSRHFLHLGFRSVELTICTAFIDCHIVISVRAVLHKN